MLDRIARELCDRVYVQVTGNVGSMRLDRLSGDVQFNRNLLRSPAFGYELQYFPFTLSERSTFVKL